MPKWVRDLEAQVIERDEGLCILCGAPAWYKPHHIIPRSRGKKYSKKFWRIENMACVCLEHHDNTRATRVKCVDKMAETYDMEWVRDFGIAWKER